MTGRLVDHSVERVPKRVARCFGKVELPLALLDALGAHENLFGLALPGVHGAGGETGEAGCGLPQELGRSDLSARLAGVLNPELDHRFVHDEGLLRVCPGFRLPLPVQVHKILALLLNQLCNNLRPPSAIPRRRLSDALLPSEGHMKRLVLRIRTVELFLLKVKKPIGFPLILNRSPLSHYSN